MSERRHTSQSRTIEKITSVREEVQRETELPDLDVKSITKADRAR